MSTHLIPQISVVPYACKPKNTLLYSSYAARPELVEAIRNLPFIGGCSKLPLAVDHVFKKIINPKLEKLRPGDVYAKMLVFVTSSNVAGDDAVIEKTRKFTREYGKTFWFKFNSRKRPPAEGFTIPDFILTIPNPKKVDHIVDEFNFKVYKGKEGVPDSS